MQQHYAAGDIIVRREEIVPHLIRIDSGRVRLETADQAWSLGDGDFFGEEGVFLGKPAAYTALASEETTVTLLPAPEAEAFLSAQPALSLRAVLRTVSRLHEKTASFSPENPHYLRVLKTILPYVAAGTGSSPYTPLPFALDQLAEMVAMNPDALRRLIEEAAVLQDIILAEDGSLSARDAETLRRRIAEGRCHSFFSAAPRKPYGRGRYNLLSRIT